MNQSSTLPLLTQMATALNLIEEAVVWTNQQGQIERCNLAFEHLIHCSAVQVIGRSFVELLPLQFTTDSAVVDSLATNLTTNLAENPIRHCLSAALPQKIRCQMQQGNCSQSIELISTNLDDPSLPQGKLFVIRTIAAFPSQVNRTFPLEFDLAQIGIWDWDLQTSALVWNAEAAVILGFTPTETHLHYQDWRACVHPQDIDQIEQAFAQALATQSSYEVEYRVIHADRSLCWVHSKGHAVYNADDEPIRIVGMLIDISKCKRQEVVLKLTETAWQDNQQLVDAILVNLPGGVSRCLYHADGQIVFTYASEAYRELVGLSPQVITFQPQLFFERFHPDDYAAWQALIESAQTTLAPGYLEYRVTAPEGEERWLARTARFSWTANGTFIVDSIDLDITERKRAEDERKQAEIALETSQQFTQKVADATPGILYVYDLIEQRNIYLNRELGLILGHTSAEVQQMESELFSLIMHPDDFAQLPDYFNQFHSLEDGVEVSWEYRLRHADGNWKWLYSRDTIFARTAAGKPCLILGTAIDITKRKQAEAALQAAEAQLQQQQGFLRAVIDNNPTLIFVKDWQGRYLLANQAVAEVNGMTLDSLLGKTVLEVYSNRQVAEEFMRQNQQIIRTLEPMFIAEEKLEGQDRWFQWQKQPIYLPEQQAYGVLGVGVDITERKQSEAALRKMVQGTASATGEAFFPVLVESLASTLGVRHAFVAEKIGNSLQTLAFWSDQQIQPNQKFDLTFSPCCRRVMDQGVYCCSNDVQKCFPNVEPLIALEADSYLGVAMLNETGTAIGNLCILDDKPLKNRERAEAILRIFAARAAAELERQRATIALQQLNQELEARVKQRTQELIASQAALQASEALFRRIFEDAPLAINLVEVGTRRILKINAAHSQIFGYSKEQITQMTFVELTHPEDIEADLQQNQRVLDNEISCYQMEKRYLKRNGEMMWGELTATLIRDQDGRPLYGLGMVADITQRKQAEVQLKASLREKEVLLKEVHHRVKNNLQMIQSLLNLQARSIDEPRILEVLAESQKRIKAMALVHEKLYQTSSLARINFAEYVRSLTRDLQQSYVFNAAVQLSIEVDNLELAVDMAIPCGLIINELFSNAIKYAFPDNGTGMITVQFRLNENQCYVLTVADNGIGIPEGINLQTVKSLGLRLVHALARQLRGTLELERHSGTRFTITFAQ